MEKRVLGCLGGCWELSLSDHVRHQNEHPWLGIYSSLKESHDILLLLLDIIL